jgi:hypothetical protein
LANQSEEMKALIAHLGGISVPVKQRGDVELDKEREWEREMHEAEQKREIAMMQIEREKDVATAALQPKPKL